MDGLIVKEPYATQLVTGKKDVEYRSTPLPKNKYHKKVYILNKGNILGEVIFNDEDYYDDNDREWFVSYHKQYNPPLKYKHKNGCVIWIKDVEVIPTVQQKCDDQ